MVGIGPRNIKNMHVQSDQLCILDGAGCDGHEEGVGIGSYIRNDVNY